MQYCPPPLFARAAASLFAVLFVFPLLPAATQARYEHYDTDPYIQSYTGDRYGYDMPGYECHRQNRYGVCTDESTYDLQGGLPGSYFVRTSPSLLRCQSPMLDCTGRVSVRVRSVPTSVRRGALITYTIYLRNDDSQTRTVYVRAFLDAMSSFQSASAGHMVDNRLVRWDAIRMEPWTSKMMILRARAEHNAPYGTELRMTVQAGNAADVVVTAVEDTYDLDKVIGYPTAQYYPLGAIKAPSYRKPENDLRNYYYDGEGVMQYRFYGRAETNYPYSRGNGCDRRYFSCEKRP